MTQLSKLYQASPKLKNARFPDLVDAARLTSMNHTGLCVWLLEDVY